MKNQEIADIFYKIADMLDILGVPFKPRAYRRAAIILESLPDDVEEIYKKSGVDGIEKIPGIGKNLSKKIVEYINTGKISKLGELKERVPGDLIKIMNIKGIGPKKVKKIYDELKIAKIEEFRKACKEHKISKIKGFGDKTEELILKGLDNLKEKRFLLGITLPIAESVVKKLKPYANKIEIAGSIRRRKETNGDIDILATSPNSNIMEKFVNLEDVKKILAHGNTKSSVILKNGIQVDLRVVKSDEFGSAIQYFTGSRSHNIKLREIAIKKNMKLNEYGLFKNEKRIGGSKEEEIYKLLGLEYIPPEMRENLGEIELAMKNKLPRLIDYKDIKGDSHLHTKWSDGVNTIEEIAKYAINLGYEYIVITDHYGLKIAHGLDEKRILMEIKKIDELNSKFKKFRIFSSVEANILPNGNIDVPNSIAKKLDFVIAAVHSKFSLDQKAQTDRIIKAMKNPYVKVIAHPTGRIIFKREPMNIDMERIFNYALKNNILMEINSSIDRLDLNDSNLRLAKKIGVKFVIGTDAHEKSQMNNMKFGIATARRGWIEKNEVVNTNGLKTFEKMIK